MHRKLGVLAVGSALALALAAVAYAAAPPTLTGESFAQGAGVADVPCAARGGSATLSFSGPATGPYTGTYTERLTVTYDPTGVATEKATFRIDAGDTTVTGTKDLTAAAYCLGELGKDYTSTFNGTYSATIVGPSGAFHDEGTTNGFFSTPFGIHEDFVSTLAEPISLGPTSKDQCKHDGWQAYGTFKSQGDCVSYVATNGKNAPG